MAAFSHSIGSLYSFISVDHFSLQTVCPRAWSPWPFTILDSSHSRFHAEPADPRIVALQRSTLQVLVVPPYFYGGLRTFDAVRL